MSKINNILSKLNEQELSEDPYYSVSVQMTRNADFDEAVKKILDWKTFYNDVYSKLDLKNKSYVGSMVNLSRNILLEVMNYMHELTVDSSTIDADYRKAVLGEILNLINEFKKSNK